MHNKLEWKKSFFSDLYKIYSNGSQLGTLKDNAFTQSAKGELNGQKYAFKTKGFFKQRTEIIDLSENKVIGEITYNSWMTKANINIHKREANWKYNNFWHTNWSISNSEGVDIIYSGSLTNGHIVSNTNNDILILSGLFVTNYYWQITLAALIAVFIPILAT